ncbi:MAG TPA: hypothetical protein VMG35_15700 [Bryobacteraceae bacterium]|nr:hypothetical protein [Bryobacteraceae bacterium]
MTGHLQRLIHGTRTPAGSIHPLIGSMFAPPKDGLKPDLAEQEVMVQNPFDPPGEDVAASAAAPPRMEARKLRALTPAQAGVRDSALHVTATDKPSEPRHPAEMLLFESFGSSPEAKEPNVIREASPAPPAAARALELHRTRPQDSTRKADEIQIHIGRIEVTAMPPAPPRPASKPSRASLNLGDYLKGRQR